jgi:RimJ/RimL family protein N-acetyltransferase
MRRSSTWRPRNGAWIPPPIKAFEDPDNLDIKFAVMLNGELVGRVDLNPVDPPKYAIGYWIDEPHNGRGVGSAAVGLAIEHARSTSSATDLYAGVVSDNRASITVLERNGFTRVAELDTHIRYHLPLDGGQPRNP